MLIRALSLFAFVSSAFALEGYKILEISSDHNDTLQSRIRDDLLQELSQDSEYDFLQLTRTEAKVLVSPKSYITISNLLSKNGIAYKVINDNVLEDAVKEKNENDKFCATSEPGNVTDCYWSHTRINKWLQELRSKYPQRVFIRHVGYSYHRRALKTIKITNGDGRKNKKVIFVDGGMHAREWISPSTALYVIYQLVENFDKNQALLRDYDWVVLPVVNADGYEYTRSNPEYRMWRKTRQPYSIDCFGADPNRNFDLMFGVSGTSDNPCSQTYGGPEPYSEPETSALGRALLSLRGNMSFYLTLHSHGSYLLYPWGFDRILASSSDELHEVAQAGFKAINSYSGRKYKVGNTAKLLYPAAGGSDDFAYGRAGARISITMELPSGGKNGFDPPPSSIRPYVEESWVGISAMAKRVIQLDHASSGQILFPDL